jgi:hypothetical protein
MTGWVVNPAGSVGRTLPGSWAAVVLGSSWWCYDLPAVRQRAGPTGWLSRAIRPPACSCRSVWSFVAPVDPLCCLVRLVAALAVSCAAPCSSPMVSFFVSASLPLGLFFSCRCLAACYPGVSAQRCRSRPTINLPTYYCVLQDQPGLGNRSAGSSEL